jgi:hypothetical protein
MGPLRVFRNHTHHFQGYWNHLACSAVCKHAPAGQPHMVAPYSRGYSAPKATRWADAQRHLHAADAKRRGRMPLNFAWKTVCKLVSAISGPSLRLLPGKLAFWAL